MVVAEQETDIREWIFIELWVLIVQQSPYRFILGV